MKGKSHSAIKTDTSKILLFLVIINILIIIIGIIYFVANWNYIPEVILTKGGRSGDQSKLEYFMGYLFFSLQSLGFAIFTINGKIDESFLKKKKISHDLFKAKKQFQIEASCFLYSFAALNLFYLLGATLKIEHQIGHVSISDKNVWFGFPITIMIIWLSHHMLWNRLTDE